MSKLVFDGKNHTLTLYDAKGQQVGQWHSNNVVDHKATLRFVPDGSYQITDPNHPHRHGGHEDTIDGAYGRFGIIRLQDFTVNKVLHSGVGVHSGRAKKGGADHATMGCIRTTDAAMEAISDHMKSDALYSISVQHNRDQSNPQPHHKADHHPHHHKAAHPR